jgi:phage FluMu protein Com
MADVTEARCGFCGKGFKLRADQLGREVRCPHCKTIVKITPQTEAAREAVQELAPATGHKRPVTSRRHVTMPQGGVRNKRLAVFWVVLIFVGLVGAVVAVAVLGSREWGEPDDAGGGQGIVGWDGERPSSGEGFFGLDMKRGPGAGEAGEQARPGAEGVVPGAETLMPRREGSAYGDKVDVEVLTLIHGIKYGTRTYAVGWVTNKTETAMASVEVFVDMLDQNEKPLGKAFALVKNLGRREEAPFVAEWDHEEGEVASRWHVSYNLDAGPPPGDQPKLAIEGDSWVRKDVGGFYDTGQVIVGLSDAPAAEVGAEVEVVSLDPAAENSVENLARLAGTIPYEVTCGLGRRARRILVA